MMSIFLQWKTLSITVLMISFICLWGRIYANDIKAQKNVLIINSYHQGLTWTKDETDGILQVLTESGDHFSTHVEYMDWKNYPSNDNVRYLEEYFEYKYQGKKIDMIIATDDAAVEFALKSRSSLFSDAPLVFCGVNQNTVRKVTSGYKNFTGILEEVDPTDTIKIALDINPSLKKVYVLFDNSESGISTGKLVDDKIRAMDKQLNVVSLNMLSYDELIKNVGSYDKDSIILVTTYYSDANGTLVEFDKASREVSENSSVPVYHLYDMGLNHGALGGNMLSGRLQGENAAKLAIRILHGENPDNIPVLSPETARKAFDFQQLKRFGIPLNKIPQGSEIINQPFSFFETYKPFVLSVLAAFMALIVFVCILLFYIEKIKGMKEKLAEGNEELTQMYEELAASDEELKQQFDELYAVKDSLSKSEERLAYLAYYDILTGLPNKLSLYENSNRKFFGSASSKAALLFVDIDNFKYINDTLGHAVGDQLIIRVGERLSSLSKENCHLYRLSGDEFIIILKGIKEKADTGVFAAHILAGFKEEFDIRNALLHVSLSIGIAIYPEQGNNCDELLRYADIAMYKAKETGKNRYVMYDMEMNEAFTERVNIEKHLRKALEKNEFKIFYQPQLDLKLHRITGLEALLRWDSKELGSVSPLKFIRVAEDTHLIVPLGTWVLRNSCAFLKKLHQKGYTDMTMSINISMLQFLQTDFTDLVMGTLEFFDIEPRFLELEVTETVLMESFETIGRTLELLRAKDVRIALDDFGKGYSSLSYLKQLPISTLKIDKSFVDCISADNENISLTGQIVMLGKNMNMSVVAEGVENQEQLEYLMKYECNKIQGYIFSKPVPEEEIEELLKANK